MLNVEVEAKLIYDVKKMMLAKYPRFGSEIASTNIEYRTDLRYHTAATDGKNIFVDPNYFASLSDDDKLFLIAHEIMHIKFMHAYRLEDKNGGKRDFDLWNTATDAIINANLERDRFKIKEGYVNRPEALQYSAEEFYQILLKESEQQEQQAKNGEQGQQGQENESGDTSNWHGDDHSLWEEAFESHKRGEDGAKKKSGAKSKETEEMSSEESSIEFEVDEKGEFTENRREKIESFKKKREQTQREMTGEGAEKIQLGDIGESRDSIDWKLLIRREIEKSETIWSQRRSIAENNYAYRLEENDIEDEAETEVMIDVSGSVDLDLVKAFLRELKPLIKESKLRVGCFNEKFWGMTKVDTARDIDNFTIPREARGDSAWTEDWDLAVRSFTKKREINKIVFTDGYPCPGTMPREDLKNENVIWLVYGNKDFKPCCGRVIQISEKQLERLHQIHDGKAECER